MVEGRVIHLYFPMGQMVRELWPVGWTFPCAIPHMLHVKVTQKARFLLYRTHELTVSSSAAICLMSVCKVERWAAQSRLMGQFPVCTFFHFALLSENQFLLPLKFLVLLGIMMPKYVPPHDLILL